MSGCEELQDFYSFKPDLDGIKNAIAAKQDNYTQRLLLNQVLEHQYSFIESSAAVIENLQALKNPNTFTICTAHQPCLFTGPLYFIYKILHACKLAAFLNEQLPKFKFVPVYYMGSEDADLEELGSIQVQGKTYKWNTNQKGAVGRMLVDDGLITLLEELDLQLVGSEKAKHNMALLRRCYQPGVSIAQATFMLVNELFQQFGLLILNPDNKDLKRSFIPFFEKELQSGFSQKALGQTMSRFPGQYKWQAAGRPINLFYLQNQQRSRIEKTTGGFVLAETNHTFTNESILAELHAQPECFSPNVILRPLLQEYLLPNVAFIGGGGELSYWLELKEVFEQAAISYPVLVLRNSFLLVAPSSKQTIDQLGLTITDFFMNETELQKKWLLSKETDLSNLAPAILSLGQLYGSVQALAARADVTLTAHVAALQKNAEKKLLQLEKKMIRALKRKHVSEMIQIQLLYKQFYPNGSLQERVENYFGIETALSQDGLDLLYTNSQSLDPLFCVICHQ